MRGSGFLLAGLMISVALINYGCSKATAPYSNDPTSTAPLSSTDKAVESASNSFSTTLFNQVSAQNNGKNFFISPLSVSMALAMTLNGASGQTYKQIQNTLGLAGISNGGINQSYHNLIAMFKALDPNVTFDIANSIWYRNTFPVLDSFVTTNSTYFNAKVTALNFDSPSAVNTMNGWVNSNTDGLIPGILSGPIPPSAVMYLINALYFHGTWEYKFPYAATKVETFYLAGGKTESDSMMTLNDTLNYYSDQSFTAIELPYGNGDYSMVVLLPAKAITSGNPIPSLSQGESNSIFAGFKPKDLDVTVPKFKLCYSINLDSVLSVVGMPDAFEPYEADFSRISSMSGLFISSVIHKTYIDVNEAGTKAAAVTSIGIRFTIAMPLPPSFDADRPFIFLIKENHNNTIMFMGAVTQPSAE